MKIRQPAVAGMFYSADARELQHDVQHSFANAKTVSLTQAPKILVLPHAGHIYSGAIAASGYQLLRARKDKISRVVLLGPSHRVALRGIALPTQEAFATPLGTIALDTDAIKTLAKLPFAGYLDTAHAQEHSLEVHLPFLQTTLDDFKLIPLVVGETDPHDVAKLLEQLWGGDETIIIISSDMSHFLPYDLACEVDARSAERILHCHTDIEGE